MWALDDSNFDKFVGESKQVLVMFHAPWAGPCNLVRPAFEEAEKRAEGTSFATFDLDDNPEVPSRCGVRAIPLFMLFRNGVIQKALAGAVSSDDIVEMLND